MLALKARTQKGRESSRVEQYWSEQQWRGGAPLTRSSVNMFTLRCASCMCLDAKIELRHGGIIRSYSWFELNFSRIQVLEGLKLSMRSSSALLAIIRTSYCLRSASLFRAHVRHAFINKLSDECEHERGEIGRDDAMRGKTRLVAARRSRSSVAILLVIFLRDASRFLEPSSQTPPPVPSRKI